MTITQAQLEAAVAAAEKKGRDEASSEFSAQGAELAELRQARKTERIDKAVNDLKAKGKLLPAKEAEFRAFAEHLLEQSGSFEFSASDGTKKPLDPLDTFHEFMAQQAPVVKLGTKVLDGSEAKGGPVDVNDARALTEAAHEFQKSEKEAGREVTFSAAVQHVTTINAALQG